MNATQLALQLFNGMVNGSFYALLALGLAIIFGVMGVVNFAQGAFYMLGAFGAYILFQSLGVGFWPSLILVPIVIGALGMLVERVLIRRLYTVDPLYNFLLTFGIALVLQDLMRLRFGIQGQPYRGAGEPSGAANLGIVFFPNYRLFVIVFCALAALAVWYLIERTSVGMVVRAATEKPDLTRALGVNVDRWITPVFGFGVALAALAGVLAAPMYNVSPLMGSEIIIVIFAVVVIGGLGSITGSVIAGFAVGIISAIAAVFFPPLSNTLVFILMAIVLLLRPAGLFGTEA